MRNEPPAPARSIILIPLEESMPKFETLSQTLTEEIRRAQNSGAYPKVAFDDERVCRRQNLAKDAATVWRPTFVHDIDKIMHCPYYTRYT